MSTFVKEFLLNQFSFVALKPTMPANNLMFQSMWNWSHKLPFLIFRVLIMAVCISYFIFDISYETIVYLHDIKFWMIYATNWSFILFSITMTVMGIGTAIDYLKPNYQFQPIFIVFMKGVYALVLNTVFVVGLAYWAALSAEDGLMTTAESRSKHTIPIIIVLLDLMLNSFVVHLAQVLLPALCGIIYIIFSFCYYKVGGVRYDGMPFVYEAVDWSTPVSAFTACMIILIFVFLMQAILFLITLVKITLKHILDKNFTLETSQVCLLSEQ